MPADDHGLAAGWALGVEDVRVGGEIFDPARHVEEVFRGAAHGGAALFEGVAVEELDGFFRRP